MWDVPGRCGQDEEDLCRGEHGCVCGSSVGGCKAQCKNSTECGGSGSACGVNCVTEGSNLIGLCQGVMAVSRKRDGARPKCFDASGVAHEDNCIYQRDDGGDSEKGKRESNQVAVPVVA